MIHRNAQGGGGPGLQGQSEIELQMGALEIGRYEPTVEIGCVIHHRHGLTHSAGRKFPIDQVGAQIAPRYFQSAPEIDLPPIGTEFSRSRDREALRDRVVDHRQAGATEAESGLTTIEKLGCVIRSAKQLGSIQEDEGVAGVAQVPTGWNKEERGVRGLVEAA